MIVSDTTTEATPASTVIHFETSPCGRCGGCGMFGPKAVKGGVCFQCGGKGQLLTRRGRTARERYDALVNERLGRRVWELAEGDVVWSHYSTWAGFQPVDSAKRWRTVARVEWTETDPAVSRIVTHDDGTEERQPLATGRVVFVTPEGKEERSVGVSATRDHFDSWLFPVYDRAALVEIMTEVARRYTGAWLDGQEPPARPVRKPRAPKPAPVAEERQEASSAASAPAPKPLAANVFAGDCRNCGGRVEAQQGERERVNGRWEVQHKPGECQERPAAQEAEEGAQEAEEAPAHAPVTPAVPTMVNRFPGKCARCGVRVMERAGERVRVDGEWITRHREGDCPADTTTKIIEVGMYARDGQVYRVKESERGNLYAERFMPPAQEGYGATFEYDPAAVYALTPADRMTREAAEEIGRQVRACCVCGTRLTRSASKGIGPVCAKKV
jgi:hypothetical protein